MTADLAFALSLGGFSFLLAVIWGDPLIEILKRLGIGKHIREEGPEGHRVKEGTPTMGGIMILIPVTMITVALNLVNVIRSVNVIGRSILVPLFVLVSFGLLGAIDDWEGVRGGKGLSAKTKFLAQLILGGVTAMVLSVGRFQFANSVYLPLLVPVPLPPTVYVPVAMLIIVGMSNAVNLTDGLDGLAGIIVASAFAAYALIAYMQGQSYLVRFCFTLVGACFAFLWYNAHPAQLFMGDTGSLALGATLGVIALMTGQWLLLPVIAFVPVAEALSVIMQVTYFKLTHGKRIFRMSPLHHHFEKLGWSETQVVQRFWLIGLLASMVGIALALL